MALHSDPDSAGRIQPADGMVVLDDTQWVARIGFVVSSASTVCLKELSVSAGIGKPRKFLYDCK